MGLDQSKNFFTADAGLLAHLQDDDPVYGYDYNRIVDALTGAYIGYTYIAHNDTFVNTENVDPGGFPARLNYVVPNNTIKVLEAVLSFKLLSYRTYNAFTVAATGNESATHTHTTDTDNSHTHSLSITNNNAATPLGIDGLNNIRVISGVGFLGRIVTSDAPFGNSGHNHGTGTESATHTHSISGSSFLGISESTGPAKGVTIQFDGADHTTALGGPWDNDIVEMDISSFLPQTQGVWHTINLTSTQLGQIQSHLRLIVLVSSPK